MSQWKKVKIGDICRIVKGTTGIASAEPGEYPLVVTAEERKTCSSYQFDQEAVCIPLVSSSGHGKKSLKNVHYQSGKFALGTILCAVIPNNPEQLDTRFLHQYLQFYKDTILVPLMKGAANVSLSMKDIAAVEIPIPPIEKQRELSDLFITLQENQKNLAAETEKQFEYTKQLRQNILQDAIEGKLTADLPCQQAGWRKHSFKNLSGKLVSEVSDKYFAYVLECDDGSLYKGFAQNLFERINRHLEGRGSEWTAKHIPVSLIYFEEFDTEKEVLEREKYFKSGSGREYINEIRNRNKLDYDAEALFEKIQEGEVRSKLRTDVLVANTPLRHEFSTENSIVSVSERTTPSAGDTPATPPFEIPKGWKWIHLGEVISYTENLDIQKKLNGLDVIKYVDIDSIDNQKHEIISYKEKTVSELSSRARRILKKDYIIYSTVRPYLCNIAIIKEEYPNYIGSTGFNVFKTLLIKKEYVFYFLLSSYIIKLYSDMMQGFNSPSINNKQFENTFFPLPPLKEQEEIVTKVETLLAKVTELENQIQERKTLSEKLAFGIIKEKLEG